MKKIYISLFILLLSTIVECSHQQTLPPIIQITDTTSDLLRKNKPHTTPQIMDADSSNKEQSKKLSNLESGILYSYKNKMSCQIYVAQM